MLQAGDQIDIWVVEKPLGSGGMGSVYRCHNRNATRILAAVKVLEGAVRASPDAEARFVREAEILFQLDHPNIVKVRNVRTDFNPPYLEMEFVEGQALEDLLQRGPMALGQAIELMEQAAGAIAYLHAKGIRHRDIKPANLLVDKNNTLKLVDFGLAMEADRTRITQSGMAFGTVSYAPPEWISPETLDPQSWDVYAVGVVFYELITGKMAFPASGQGSARQQAMQVIVGKQNHPPLDPGEGCPAAVRELIKAATCSDPKQRLGSANALWQRLQALSADGRHAGVTLAPMEVDLAAFGLDESTSDRTPKRAAENPAAIADTWVTEEHPSLKPARGGLPVAILAVAGLVLVLAMGGLGAVLAYFALPADTGPELPTTRPVEVLVLGVPEDVTVKVRVEGQPPGIGSGMSTTFAAIPPGPVTLHWVMGEECPLHECPGASCPAWCPAGTATDEVRTGDGTEMLRLNLSMPAPRAVALKTDLQAFARATLGGRPGSASDGALRFEVPPGRHALEVDAGTCPEPAIGCAERGDCPKGCASTRRIVEVAAGEGVQEGDLGLVLAGRAPVPVPTPGEPRPTPVPTPKPEPSGGGGTTGLVTGAKFARFLADNPDYQRGGKRASSDGVYLSGWNGAEPPADLAGKPVSNVHGLAAATYCKWTGRALPGVADPPAVPDPNMEYRVAESGGFVVLMEDGSPIPVNDPKKANSFATFRCTK
ncbi:MAG: serine/threonine protein kinase [Alphaproteobacteria bacterium]|nr:serine/threonine protein kinase [Alphaproteobacteria bacterium]